MTSETEAILNPYVGPRTFTREQRHLYFGREREAQDLLARVLSERLVLFYAQSGAGKSSLINTRLIPDLWEAGYAALPVARVGGEVPAGIAEVDNIFLLNLMLSLDQSGDNAQRLAGLTLSQFLAGLSSEDGEQWAYIAPSAVPADKAGASQPYVLIVDQFEEIITGHPGRWEERTEFFRQLNQAMLDDPDLWVVLTLREDYIAPIEPYAPLMADRMRARFYMERMSVNAALDAVRKPAELEELGDRRRPFAPGVAEQLVDNLRQVRVPGLETTIAGQYVEPVQLQVVCYQLWENLERGTGGAGGPKGIDPSENSNPSNPSDKPTPEITLTDLAAAGDVDQALTQFYEETLAAALADPAAAGVSERQLRAWFDEELITEAGTRGFVHQGEQQSGGLPNGLVRALQKRFIVRAETRGGDAWIELVHDRFVEPIRANNAAWFPLHLSALQRQAALWDEQGRSSGLLLRDAALAEAEGWAAANPDELAPHEQDFLTACREAHQAAERERRQGRRIRMLAVAAVAISILAFGAAIFAWTQTQRAKANAYLASRNAALAEARIAQVGQLVGNLGIERLLSMARQLDEAGDAGGAIALLQTAVNLNPALLADLNGDTLTPDSWMFLQSLLQTAVNLNPALLTDLNGDTLTADSQMLLASVSFIDRNETEYAFIPAGTFTMGSDVSDMEAYRDETPLQSIYLPSYWIGRTKVTNDQYAAFVDATGHLAPYHWKGGEAPSGKGDHPVVNVSWDDAVAYTAWLSAETGQAFRLPTEAEWEKACRGTSGLIYPWGDTFDANKANTVEGGPGETTPVGSYSSAGGDSPYGVADMAGNVWEWTSSQYKDYPYDASDGREYLTDRVLRVQRGGSFFYDWSYARCAARLPDLPDYLLGSRGFRVGFAAPSASGN